jgi:hypothetical protein
MPLPLRMLWTLVLCLSVSDLARAATITGTVVDSKNVAVVGARVFVRGVTIPAVTNSSGFFVIVVATGTYDIQIVPGGTALVPVEFRAVQVIVNTNLGTITLQPGFAITGKAVSGVSTPVPNADLNYFDEASGKLLFTPSDNTDVNGDFIAIVPAGTYRVEIRPAPTVLLVAVEIRNVVVSAAKSLGNVKMRAGALVSGTVVGGVSNTPVANVNIDARDQLGRNIKIPNDRSAATGTFSIILPLELVRLTFAPPSSTNYAGLELLNQNITTTTNLGLIKLTSGFRLTGRLRGPGSKPVINADIDVDTAVGNVRIYTPRDNTDATGTFSVVVPPGSYKITYEPRKTDLLVAVQSGTTTVSSNTTVPTVTLVPGVLLSGTLTAYDSKPEAAADIDIISPTTGLELVTPSDDTDALGRYSVVIPTGTWNVRYQPGKTSLSRVETVTSIVVSAARTLNRRLTLVPIGTYFATSGTPTIPNGTSIPAILAFVNPTTQTQATKGSIVFIDPLGKETVIVGPLNLSVPRGFSFVTLLITPTPSINPSLLGLSCRLETRFDDPTTGREQDHSRFKFFVK